MNCVLPLTLFAPKVQAQATLDAQWTKVQQLKPGTAIHIKTTQAKTKCNFRSADAAALTCTYPTNTTFARADIRSISIAHRGRSTLVGLVLGGGIGAAAGAASGQSNGIINRGGAAGIFGVAAGVVGAAIGAATDFSHGTVYRNP